jgi:transcriptional regulator with GAF, ATPase, and Fis domain
LGKDTACEAANLLYLGIDGLIPGGGYTQFFGNPDELLARGYASCIAVPLIAYGKPRGAVDLHGTLNLCSAQCNAFDENTIEYYTGLATSVTYAVTALRASEERKRARDALQAAQAELARATSFTAMG